MHLPARTAAATVLVACVLFAGASARAAEATTEWSRIYEGTIGGQRVVALLYNSVAAPDTIAGKYHYRRHAESIDLVPVPGSRLLAECPPSDDRVGPCAAPSGTWDVTPSESRVVGFWTPPAGSPKQPIELKRLAVVERRSLREMAPGNDKAAWRESISASDRYQRLLAADDHQRVLDEARPFGVVWKTTRIDGENTGRLTKSIVLLASPDAAARARINAWLGQNVAAPDKNCDAAENGACDDGNDIEVRFANDRYFAVAGNTYWEGGAHPSNGTVMATFDLRTGKKIVWADLVRIDDEGATPDSGLDLTRTDILAAPVLRMLVEQGYANLCLADAVEHYGCKGDRCESRPGREEVSLWEMYPTAAGMRLAIETYNEAGRGCRGETMTVPWPIVKKTLKQPMPLP